MAILLDTGIVYAYYDRSDSWHTRARKLMESEQHGLVVPAPVIPEVDHLLGVRLGTDARRLFYRGIVESYFLVVDLPRYGYARVAEIDRRYAELDLGFVNAAVFTIAESAGIRRVATTDRRNFEPVARELGVTLLP